MSLQQSMHTKLKATFDEKLFFYYKMQSNSTKQSLIVDLPKKFFNQCQHKTLVQMKIFFFHLSISITTMCVSEFCCDEFVDGCGTKNPNQNCLSL
jgi:hypothetical protein